MHSALPGAGYDVKSVSLALFQVRPGVSQPVPPPPPDPLLLPDPLPLPDPLLVLPEPLLLLPDPPLLPLAPPLPPLQVDDVTLTLVAALKSVLSVE
jgi:hypothetical protein